MGKDAGGGKSRCNHFMDPAGLQFKQNKIKCQSYSFLKIYI